MLHRDLLPLRLIAALPTAPIKYLQALATLSNESRIVGSLLENLVGVVFLEVGKAVLDLDLFDPVVEAAHHENSALVSVRSVELFL